VPLDLLEDIRRESDRFHAVLSTCDPGARVPACPDWDAADLLWHLTDVQWFWTRVITTRPAAPPEDLEHPQRPESYEELLSGFAAQSAALVEALAEAGPDAEAWHWSAVQTAGTSYRRQAHEALIHRLDAEQTAGQVTPLDPALAADGVREALDVMYGGEHPDFVGAGAPGCFRVVGELGDEGAVAEGARVQQRMRGREHPRQLGGASQRFGFAEKGNCTAQDLTLSVCVGVGDGRSQTGVL
jgi:uncharacterized protein (TIGR03083 family)